MRYVYCHPLFDERKCAHRFSYELKTTFEATGLHLERFDYRGTGEAAGEFSQVSLDTLRADISQHIRGEEACLVGVRFGASLAFDYCAGGAGNVRNLILVEPVIDGAKYVDYLRRKQHIKNVMTGGASDTLKEEGCENIEGYKTSSKFVEEMNRFDLRRVAAHCGTVDSVFIVQISDGSKIARDIVRVLEVFEHHNTRVTVEHVKLPVFWRRIPSTDYGVLTTKIVRWCRG